jgi:hypothetical protein
MRKEESVSEKINKVHDEKHRKEWFVVTQILLRRRMILRRCHSGKGYEQIIPLEGISFKRRTIEKDDGIREVYIKGPSSPTSSHVHVQVQVLSPPPV